MSKSKIVVSNLILFILFSLVFVFNKASLAIAEGTDEMAKKANLVLPVNDASVDVLSRVPDFSLIDHRGQNVELADFYGYVWIVNVTHTRCGEACAVNMSLMDGMQSALKKANFGSNLRFVTLSMEPEHDSVEVLSDYVKKYQLDTNQWHLLSGSRQAIWNLSYKGLQIPAKGNVLQKEGVISDSPQFVLIDWESRIRGYYEVQTQNDLNAFKQDILSVIDERTAVPETVVVRDNKDPRQQQQIDKAKTLEIFTDFAFSDILKKSNITFKHNIVDDVGINYKAVHYDHGNGIAIADVDLDGYSDIYFTTLSGSNELWRNLGNGEFENITQTSGLYLADRVGMGASFADIDNDGDPDLYISNVRVGNVLYENDGKGKFTDITKVSGTGVKAHSSAAVFFDYDRDGLLDLFIANVGKYTSDKKLKTTQYSDRGQIQTEYEYYEAYKDAFAGHLKPERYETSVLFKNLGNNRFEDVSKKVNLLDDSWSGDATVIDANNDGWPDLYILSMQGNDEYYENQQGKTFVRKSRKVFPKTPWGAMGVKSFDYDNDGDMDLYITDMHSDMRKDIGIAKEKLKADNNDPETFLRSGGNSIFGNAFYRNEGNGQYVEISDEIGLENYWPWGPSSGDLNADGYEDLFVASSMAYPFRYSVNSVLLNNQGKNFMDSEYVLGVEPRKNAVTSAPWFEIDCAQANKGHIGCLGSTTPGRTVVWGAVGTRSSVIFDLDNDGDQDIVTLEFNQAPMVLQSNLSDQHKINFVKVNLRGKQSNRSGLGATVKVYAGKDVYSKVYDGKSGYLSQSAAPLYFGLGNNTKLKKIEVTWPSGKNQTLTENIESNKLIVITEP